ncbi:MAG: glycine cleavage system aminomethyltransferase GcvT [Chitinophagales bacterium]
MKKTALYDIHNELGAKIVPFAGYEMPVSYTSIKEEHLAVRNHVGLFDVSHMGEFGVFGKDATALIDWICSNNVSKMVDMQCQYNCMPNTEGGIVDDLIVYRWNAEEYTLVVNASNIEKDLNWINEQVKSKSFDVTLDDMSEKLSLIAVQGPKAMDVVQSLTDVDCSAIKYYHFAGGKVANIDDIVISNTGYTGSGGFELYVWNKGASALWQALMKAGEKHEIKPCGLAARDTLRLEKGFCLYGNDINDTTSPIEAGLGWITKFKTDFVHSDYHKNLKENGVERTLVGFEMLDRGIPRKDYTIIDESGNEIGVVTSGTQSPCLDKAIGMGYVKPSFKNAGSEIWIQVRKKQLKAKVVKMPFV